MINYSWKDKFISSEIINKCQPRTRIFMKHTKKDRPNFLFETKHWKVYLNPDQYYLGRSVVVAKRDVGSLSDLTKDEWLDFTELIKKIEATYKKSFGATMFNWTCLMNNAYKNDPPNPHVHWHLLPRYKKAVTFKGIDFGDNEFGSHYARKIDRAVPDEVFSEIVKVIKKFSRQYRTKKA